MFFVIFWWFVKCLAELCNITVSLGYGLAPRPATKKTPHFRPTPSHDVCMSLQPNCSAQRKYGRISNA